MKKFPKKFGFAFGDSVESSKKRKVLPGIKELQKAEDWQAGPSEASGGARGREKGIFGRRSSATHPFIGSPYRLVPIYFIFAAAVLVLLGRAFDLQVIQGRIFLGKAKGNHFSLEVNHAPRGVIFDRDGAILAQNQPGFRLRMDTQGMQKEKKDQVISKLTSILGVSKSEIEEKLKKANGGEVTLVNDLPGDKARSVEASKSDLPGIELEINPIRYYPFKEITAHILGYTAEADEADLARKLAIPYALGDKVGKAGVEATFEETLRGVNGYRLVKVTAHGDKIGEIYQSEPTSGQSVILSIDLELQKFVYETLEKKLKEVKAKGGSAVVSDPYTGEVLAIVSIPSYDNNLFSESLTTQAYRGLISNPDKILLNRAIGAAYPPGSTFKMVTASAGLETGAITPQTKLVDSGYVALGNQVFENWLWRERRKTEGAIDVVRAIARSTDTFFYLLGQMVGEKAMVKYARSLGLGQKTGIELTGETAGLIPTEEWKLAAKGEPWYPGDTINMSIGQGDVLVSPLQLTVVTTLFANGGKLLAPTILKTDTPKAVRENILKKETIDAVREGLYQDTIGDGNVGWLFGSFKIPSAGKTGSAESEQGKPYAWYTAFSPYQNPKIVVTVQAEDAGHGSEVSAPVVKQIFEWWFANRN